MYQARMYVAGEDELGGGRKSLTQEEAKAVGVGEGPKVNRAQVNFLKRLVRSG